MRVLSYPTDNIVAHKTSVIIELMICSKTGVCLMEERVGSLIFGVALSVHW